MQKKALVIFICVFIIFSSLLSLPASAVYGYELNSEKAAAEAYYIYNYENDTVMASKGFNEIISPSSTAKMMTALVALELCNDTSKEITVTDEMTDKASGRMMNLKVGDRITVLDLLYSVVCGGYNDASLVLASYLGGNEADFVAKMNEKAASIGMESTVYKNATGLDAHGAETSLRDIKLLAEELIKNELFCKIASSATYTLSGNSTCEKRTIHNRSSLVGAYKGAINLNVGGGGSGDCAVHYYKKNELSYICIVMNAKAYDIQDEENYGLYFSEILLDHALTDYTYKTVYEKGDKIGTIPILHSATESEIGLYCAEDVKIFIPKSDDALDGIIYSFFTNDEKIKAPVKEGQKLGTLLVCKDGKVLASVALVSGGEYKSNAFLVLMDAVKNYVMSITFLFTVIIFAILMTVYYLWNKKRMKRIYGGRRRK